MSVVVVGASFGVVLVADLEWGPLLVGRGVVLAHCFLSYISFRYVLASSQKQ